MIADNPDLAASYAEEKELVSRMLAGDETAFERFSDEYFPALYRFARARLGGRQELVKEIVQNTVVKVMGRLDSFRGEASLATWLCACCRNEIALHFRTQSRRPHLVELPDDDPEGSRLPLESPSEEPEQEFLRGETAQIVHEALDLLPPRYARALEWKYIDGLAVREIAVRLEVGVKAAESILTRSRNAFREGYSRLMRSPAADAFLPDARSTRGVM